MLVVERNKIMMFLYGSMFVAVVLGVYAQDIAYFLYNNLTIPLLAGLSLVTILSVLFFLIPPVLISKNKKQYKVRKKDINIYLVINALLGIVVSAFSLIVLAAWWG